MNDFSKRVKQAEREVKAKAKSPQIRRKKKAPKTAVKKGQRLSPSTEFQPGQSGNPGGRPKRTPITDAMRAYLMLPYDGKEKKYKGLNNADVLAIRQFELAIEDGDMGAAKEIADRVEGKVPQRQEFGGPEGGAIPFVNVSPAENEKRIMELMARSGGDGNR
jgi:hypothetical protein